LSEPEIAGLLKTSGKTVKRLIESEELPTVEILLCIYKLTGVLIDWLLMGEDVKDTSFQMPSYVFKEAGAFDMALNEILKSNDFKIGL
jgi:hypothetical protein